MLWNASMCVLVAVALQGAERVVDLTPKSDNESLRAAGLPGGRDQVDCRGRSTGRVGPPPSLTLAITGLDRSELSMGGSFVADIRVTNTGTETVLIPSARSFEFGDGYAGKDYAVQASLGIRGVDAQGREHAFFGAVLRGSPRRPGTVESLKPGESLTLRLPGFVVIMHGPDAPISGDAHIFARLLLSDNQCRDWSPVRSQGARVRFKAHQ